ncbi:hypothetical protein V6N11_016086 [Hibiscus sabdariffa]|uniref:Uncharacterized protein n=1 Tax=Hibiscus sabdariffa TaxID=183260 RepID=A0ABR2TTY1_9ROSI
MNCCGECCLQQELDSRNPKPMDRRPGIFIRTHHFLVTSCRRQKKTAQVHLHELIEGNMQHLQFAKDEMNTRSCLNLQTRLSLYNEPTSDGNMHKPGLRAAMRSLGAWHLMT